MPNMKRSFDTWSSEATSFAVWIVSRWITKQIAVASLSRLVTAAAALNVTNGSITSKYSLVSAASPRGWMGEPASHRHVCVLRHPQRIKAALLQRHRQIGRRHRIIGKEDCRANFHDPHSTRLSIVPVWT